MMIHTSCFNTVYTRICWNLFWLLKITFNNKDMYLHRRGNNIISYLSNLLLVEALGVARIIIPALFFSIVNNVCTVRRITPQNDLIFHCKVKKKSIHFIVARMCSHNENWNAFHISMVSAVSLYRLQLKTMEKSNIGRLPSFGVCLRIMFTNLSSRKNVTPRKAWPDYTASQFGRLPDPW